MADIQHSALKWPGGKAKLAEKIGAIIGRRPTTWVEPFVGACGCALNVAADHYLLADANLDLINFYTQLRDQPAAFDQLARGFFQCGRNTPEAYYALRHRFNHEDRRGLMRAALFLYLNRHGYNGLVRYNSAGGYNVPFGRYKGPTYPESGVAALQVLARNADFRHGDFEVTMAAAPAGSAIYCDPPYLCLKKGGFTTYAPNGFSVEDHTRLVNAAKAAANNGCTVIIANHDTPLARQLYADSTIMEISATRSIGRNHSSRKLIGEVMAVFRGG